MDIIPRQKKERLLYDRDQLLSLRTYHSTLDNEKLKSLKPFKAVTRGCRGGSQRRLSIAYSKAENGHIPIITGNRPRPIVRPPARSFLGSVPVNMYHTDPHIDRAQRSRHIVSTQDWHIDSRGQPISTDSSQVDCTKRTRRSVCNQDIDINWA